MPANTAAGLEALDAALGRLRRLWEAPAVRQRLLALMGADVEPSLVRTLRAIELSEVTEPGVGDLAVALRVDNSTASRLVDHAVQAEALERTISTRDRRRCVLRLTSEGHRLLREALQARTTFLQEAVADWDPVEFARLTDLLDRFTAAVARAGAVR